VQGLNSADDGKDDDDDGGGGGGGGGGDDDDNNNNNNKPSNRNKVHVECKNRSDNTNYRSNWNGLKIIQKICASLTGKAQNQGAAKKKEPYRALRIYFV
jgi:hypothetical protein